MEHLLDPRPSDFDADADPEATRCAAAEAAHRREVDKLRARNAELEELNRILRRDLLEQQGAYNKLARGLAHLDVEAQASVRKVRP